MGWNLDTYNGSSVRTDEIYYPVGIPSSSFAATGNAPTAAEYRAAFKLVISTFNEVNSTVVADLTDAELPSTGTNPTVEEMLTGAGHIVTHINTVIDALPILLPTANIFPNATTSGMRTGLLTLLSIIDNKIANKYYSVLKKNTGFIKRKNYLFNPLSNIMTDSQAGSFSLRIPLEHLFSFCEN
jgi:hypothetical protein